MSSFAGKQLHFVVFGVLDDDGKVSFTVDSADDAYFPDGPVFDEEGESGGEWQAYPDDPDEQADAQFIERILLKRLADKSRTRESTG